MSSGPSLVAKERREPSIEAIQRDVAFGNTFRLEKLKTILAISTALLAFTVSFRPKLTVVHVQWALIVGWAGLSVTLLAGIATMQAWEEFYLSYRDFDWRDRGDEGLRYRMVVTRWRRVLFACLCAGFLAGVIGIGLFAALNIDNLKS